MKFLLNVVLVIFFAMPFTKMIFLTSETVASETVASETVSQDISEDTEDIEVAVITGRVTSDINGSPLVGVAIRLIDAASPDDQVVTAYTDAAGLYTVTQSISNSWKIMFEPTLQLDYPYISEYYNDVHQIGNAEIITAEVGTVTSNINASLAVKGQITGRVTAEVDGQPIANIHVSAYRLDDEYDGETGVTNTNSTGAYTLTLYFGGIYKVQFTPPINSEYAVEYYNDKYSFSEAESVTVAEGSEMRGIDVALAQGGKITGTVTSNWKDELIEYPAVRVLNEAGELIQSGGRGGDAPPGSYVVANLPAGTYQVQFVANRHAPVYYPSLISVAAGDVIPEINAQLPISVIVESIATSPAIPDTIVLGFAHDPAPVVTLDGGRHWEILPSTTWVADEIVVAYPDRIPIHGMATGIAPRGLPGEGTRFLVTVGPDGGNEEIHSGLYRSGDYGASWVASEVAPAFSTPICIQPKRAAYTVSPMQPAQLYLIIQDCRADLTKLLVSHNGGVTWQVAEVQEGGLSPYYNYYLVKVLPSPIVKDRVYLFDSISSWYQSNDGGISWENKNFPIESLALDAQHENLLYGWSPRYGGPYKRIGRRSWDGGATWEDWPAEPCPYSYREEPPLMLAHPTESGVLFLRCDNDLTDGIYRSDDNGSHWTKLPDEKGQLLAIDYSTPGRILWAKDDGLYASTDQGESWQVLLQDYGILSTSLYLPNVATDEP